MKSGAPASLHRPSLGSLDTKFKSSSLPPPRTCSGSSLQDSVSLWDKGVLGPRGPKRGWNERRLCPEGCLWSPAASCPHDQHGLQSLSFPLCPSAGEHRWRRLAGQEGAPTGAGVGSWHGRPSIWDSWQPVAAGGGWTRAQARVGDRESATKRGTPLTGGEPRVHLPGAC